jgi:hypothetical protein
MRLAGALLFVLLVIVMMWSAQTRKDEELYKTTQSTLRNRHLDTSYDMDDGSRPVDLAGRIKDSGGAAKAKAPRPAPLTGEKKQVVVDDSAVAGRKKYPIHGQEAVVDTQTQEDHEVTVVLNGILKRSPSKFDTCLQKAF